MAYRTEDTYEYDSDLLTIKTHLTLHDYRAKSREIFTIDYTYHNVEHSDEAGSMFDDSEILYKFRNQLREASLNCTKELANLSPGSRTMDSITKFEGETGREVSFRANNLDFLHLMRIFFVLIRNSNKPRDKQLTFHKLIYFPNAAFKLNLIQQPFKLVGSPLTTYLTRKNSGENSSESKKRKSKTTFGFVSMDKNMRMLPIMPNDPLLDQVPLLGVWIFGLSTLVIPSLFENLFHFFMSR